MFDEDIITWLCWAYIKGSQLEKKKERKRKKKSNPKPQGSVSNLLIRSSPLRQQRGECRAGPRAAPAPRRAARGQVGLPRPHARGLKASGACGGCLFRGSFSSGCALAVAFWCYFGGILVLFQRCTRRAPGCLEKQANSCAASPWAWLWCVCSFHFELWGGKLR